MTKEQAINYLKSSGFSDEQIEAVTEALSEERKTGKWIKQNPMVDTEECSECGWNIVSEELETPYCPYCGAKMKGA